MSRVPPPQGLVLALHPSYSGLGWVAFEGPFSPYDWGTVFASADKNAKCLRRLEHMLERFRPEILVLEAFEGASLRRTARVQNFCRAAVALARERGHSVVVYTRRDVQACYATVGAMSRQEIADAVARQFECLRSLLPRKRRAWESESCQMSVFCAAALGLTHYQRDRSDVAE